MQINVWLTEESQAGWQDTADRYGTTITALLEVLGLSLAAGHRTPTLDELGEQARELSQARKRRQPRPSHLSS